MASRVAEQFKTEDLKKLGNISKLTKVHNDSRVPSISIKMKVLLILEENSWKIEIKFFPLCANSHEN